MVQSVCIVSHLALCSGSANVNDSYRVWSLHILLQMLVKSFEPAHDKANKMTRAPSEDLDTWASVQSDQSLHFALNG